VSSFVSLGQLVIWNLWETSCCSLGVDELEERLAALRHVWDTGVYGCLIVFCSLISLLIPIQTRKQDYDIILWIPVCHCFGLASVFLEYREGQNCWNWGGSKSVVAKPFKKKKTHRAANFHFGPKLSWFCPGSLKSSLSQHKLHFFFSPWLAGLMEWTFSYIGKERLRVSHLERFALKRLIS